MVFFQKTPTMADFRFLRRHFFWVHPVDIVAVQCGPAGGPGPGEAVLLLHLPGPRGVLVRAAPL